MKALKSYIDSNGRLAIPSKIRKKLHLNKGDEVSLKYSDSELVVSTYHTNIEKVREVLKKYGNPDLQNTLKTLRKQNLDDQEK
jgi:AbrB family looped-hinge helix DNA binding protein